MKLHLSNADGLNTFTAYGDNYVDVNGQRHTANVVVLPEQLLPEWTAARFETLSEADFAILAGLKAEILLLGTGKTLRFPSPALLQPLMAARIGLEVMDNHAACRTYNILAAEGRKVAAAILL
ncbi:MAG: hypothetical protein QG616_6 [Pseudomonadota bacterium]|nr:hypothetical protein [Pseudomonadota bacterium]MDQ5880177.1 hypothetical protein [Pseudomonadota bacterium]MDQ5903011.1 hypothetical protein [Pseudomonadota bacterium]MDQ5906257.1 hypothetical protein [Pseudomonadota bacterium]MDQ5918735.1 hypothetical protein [Pseudomonadota bacterium]